MGVFCEVVVEVEGLNLSCLSIVFALVGSFGGGLLLPFNGRNFDLPFVEENEGAIKGGGIVKFGGGTLISMGNSMGWCAKGGVLTIGEFVSMFVVPLAFGKKRADFLGKFEDEEDEELVPFFVELCRHIISMDIPSTQISTSQ